VQRELAALLHLACDEVITSIRSSGPAADGGDQDHHHRAAVAEHVHVSFGRRRGCGERRPMTSFTRRALPRTQQAHECLLERALARLRDQLVRRAPATTRPWPRMTMRSHSAVTSCITWEENRRHLPCARRLRSMSRSARVLMMSSPLVGSSSSMCRGRGPARGDRNLHRSPCEKPCVRGRQAARAEGRDELVDAGVERRPDRPCSSP